MSDLTTEQMREYVKARWEFVAERHHPPTIYRIQLNRIWQRGLSIGYFKNEADAWKAAYDYTIDVERQIAEVERQIDWVKFRTHDLSVDRTAEKLIARLQAARAEIAKGYKEPE